ncbi:hypothetical protein D9M71_447520 [compost metagenome]
MQALHGVGCLDVGAGVEYDDEFISGQTPEEIGITNLFAQAFGDHAQQLVSGRATE